MDDFKPGDRVLVKNPENWIKPVTSKIKDREGVLRFFRSDRVWIVDFPAVGRKKSFTHQFYPRDLTPLNGGR